MFSLFKVCRTAAGIFNQLKSFAPCLERTAGGKQNVRKIWTESQERVKSLGLIGSICCAFKPFKQANILHLGMEMCCRVVGNAPEQLCRAGKKGIRNSGSGASIWKANTGL